MFSKLFGKDKSKLRSDRWTFGIITAFGFIGLMVAFILTYEKQQLLIHPDAQLSCSINVVLNCASVMKTWQATLFGFPNSWIGLMAYPVVITFGIAGLTGARFSKWFLRAAHVGFGLGLIFAYWLFFQSVFVIQVLCPWCLLVTFATTILFETLTRYNLRENVYNFKKPLNTKIQAYLDKDLDKLIVAGWIVFLIGLVVLRFGDGLFA